MKVVSVKKTFDQLKVVETLLYMHHKVEGVMADKGVQNLIPCVWILPYLHN